MRSSASLATLQLTQITPSTIAEPAALLAELRRIRAQGFALVDQEFEEGLRALAAPHPRRATGTSIAAVNVAVHASRWSIEAIHDDLLPRLLRATAAIEADLRDAPVPAPPARARADGAAPAAEPAPDAGDRETDFVQSLQRGLAVIRAFDAENPALTLSDVAKITGLARAAARRFVLTLVELGYMRADGRLFRLSPRVLELGAPYLTTLTLPEIARAAPARLRRRGAGVVVGRDARRERHPLRRARLGEADHVRRRSARRHARPGVRHLARPRAARGPARCGCSRRCSTACGCRGSRTPRSSIRRRCSPSCGEIRAQGYALVDQELEEGLRALAVPLHDEHGEVVAAVNVAVHASRWSIERDPRRAAAAAARDRGRDRGRPPGGRRPDRRVVCALA